MKTIISLAAVMIALGLGPTSAMAEPFDLLQTFKDPNPGQFDNFGESIAGVGNNVLVGSRSGTRQEAGAAYLFDGSTGNLLGTFRSPTPGDGGAYESFGGSVATVGSDLLIGAKPAVVYLFQGPGIASDWTGPAPGVSPAAALGSEAVPEPSTLLLASFAALALVLRPRRPPACRGACR